MARRGTLAYHVEEILKLVREALSVKGTMEQIIAQRSYCLVSQGISSPQEAVAKHREMDELIGRLAQNLSAIEKSILFHTSAIKERETNSCTTILAAPVMHSPATLVPSRPKRAASTQLLAPAPKLPSLPIYSTSQPERGLDDVTDAEG